MATIDVETYQGVQTGPALSPTRELSLEDEIREHALIAQRNGAQALGLLAVVTRCDRDLARLRCARQVPFPLLSAEEERVWRAFLPTRYVEDRTPPRGVPPGLFGITLKLVDYAFDLPPLSVLDLWQDAKARTLLDTFEIWTPERPMPEPILVGYKAFDTTSVGPFLLARWGESLVPFEEIQQQVAARGITNSDALMRSLGVQRNMAITNQRGTAWSGFLQPLGGGGASLNG